MSIESKENVVKNTVGAGQWLSQEVLAMQAQGPEPDSQDPQKSLA